MNVMVALLGLSIGCMADPVVGPNEGDSTQAIGGDSGGGCPVWGCGSNTSNMGGIPFTDLHETGVYNSAHFKIERFEKRDVSVRGGPIGRTCTVARSRRWIRPRVWSC